MAKEKTTLINMRIPDSILKEFDEIVESDPLIPSRTARVVAHMYGDIQVNRRKIAREKKN